MRMISAAARQEPWLLVLNFHIKALLALGSPAMSSFWFSHVCTLRVDHALASAKFILINVVEWRDAHVTLQAPAEALHQIEIVLVAPGDLMRMLLVDPRRETGSTKHS